VNPTAPSAPIGSVPGPLLFARFAYPPNAHGYCGPDDSAALIGHAAAGESGTHLVALARQFAGAWPYLELIAASAGRADPLDAGVVEAYWVGNRLLERVSPRLFAAHLADRFSTRAGRGQADLTGLALLGAVPHHNFHVFGVYPWVGLLRAGPAAEEPLRVLNSCRVRWGTVLDVHDGLARVASQPVVWDGRALRLGPVADEQVLCSSRAGSLTPTVRPGDRVAMHWEWICDVLDRRRLSRLTAYTARILTMTNEALRRPVAAAVLS
jgi:hypothetical protein